MHTVEYFCAVYTGSFGFDGAHYAAHAPYKINQVNNDCTKAQIMVCGHCLHIFFMDSLLKWSPAERDMRAVRLEM